LQKMQIFFFGLRTGGLAMTEILLSGSRLKSLMSEKAVKGSERQSQNGGSSS
jgi:hypothetical protein